MATDDTMNSIRLSVIIPTYNCRDYLDEGLRSVLGQLPADCELILADDGSDDGTAELLARYEGIYENVHAVYGTHKGASAARNAGLDKASGEFVTFIDCDDCMREGFLSESLPLLDDRTDLYIFGIERIPLSGSRELWEVRDRVYPDVSAFADEYIRVRSLLIYSNCNKFYRRSIIEQLRLRFDEDKDFGEDRLFNYRYLPGCRGQIRTSSLIMLRYIQRSACSMSSRHIPSYFSCVRLLHKAKTDCFLSLSGNTDDEEKRNFIASDFSCEVRNTLARFAQHPEEKAENLPAINRIVFGETDDGSGPLDVLVVLGSSRCEYKIRRAFEIGRRHPGMIYIVSGGNPSAYGGIPEAEFMKSWLLEHGVSAMQISLENRAHFTQQNLEYSMSIINKLRAEHNRPLSKIGILTSGFHIPRAQLLASCAPSLEKEDVRWLAAYSPHMHPENWFGDESVRDTVLGELHKTVALRSRLCRRGCHSVNLS